MLASLYILNRLLQRLKNPDKGEVFFINNMWRERDSNPRIGYKPITPLAGERLQPLGHLSKIYQNNNLNCLLKTVRKTTSYNSHHFSFRRIPICLIKSGIPSLLTDDISK